MTDQTNSVSKPWWSSKTIWLNVIGALLWGLQEFAGKDIIAAEHLVIAMIVLNVIMRSITTQPLGGEKDDRTIKKMHRDLKDSNDDLYKSVEENRPED